MFQKMVSHYTFLFFIVITVIFCSCNGNSSTDKKTPPKDSTTVNPLLQKWDGPYGGVPPFDKVKVANFKPAIEAAMAENISEIDKLVFYPNPSFDNVINYNKTIKKDDIIGVFDSSGKKIDFINKNDFNQLEILGNDAGSVFIKFKEEGKIKTERILFIR